ncbi:hypothetical protein AAVH_43516 [Aphelenchoides avenae]|nr:hypothetical protein AAVH_43516 [Aphelenchus avenae]
MLENVGKLELVEMFLSAALNQIYEHTVEQFAKLETVARALANESAALVKNENDALGKQTSNVKVDQQQRNDKFIALAEKAASDTEALNKELERVKARARKADGEAMELRRRLAQANEDMCSLQTSNGELSEKVTSLEEQLEEWIAYGKDASVKAENLEEKLRCSICMDQPKDTAFACGHTCCGQCASEWKKCYYNCQSERRQKPIKHSFPIYL